MTTGTVGKSQVEETGGLGGLLEVEPGDAADDEFAGAEAPDLSCGKGFGHDCPSIYIERDRNEPERGDVARGGKNGSDVGKTHPLTRGSRWRGKDFKGGNFERETEADEQWRRTKSGGLESEPTIELGEPPR